LQEKMARIYRPRPEQDRVALDEMPPVAAVGVEAPVPASETPGDPIEEGQACWECRLTAEVHRHARGGGLWQEGYRIPCNCAIVGGVVNGALWDALWYGHHYRCIWWSFEARESRRKVEVWEGGKQLF
jgi:hypothetical protein